MSYCRWSSDWGESDVYVYEDVSGGWTTHVAGRRVKHRVPDEIRQMIPPMSDPGWVEGYMASQKAEQEWRRQFPHEVMDTVTPDGEPGKGLVLFADSEYLDLSEIGPQAGESYNDPTPGECADRLESLRETGFNVPQYAIDALREEQAEMDA